jgi:Concanavalin A-like lectin/glucanases superfamily
MSESDYINAKNNYIIQRNNYETSNKIFNPLWINQNVDYITYVSSYQDNLKVYNEYENAYQRYKNVYTSMLNSNLHKQEYQTITNEYNEFEEEHKLKVESYNKLGSESGSQSGSQSGSGSGSGSWPQQQKYDPQNKTNMYLRNIAIAIAPIIFIVILYKGFQMYKGFKKDAYELRGPRTYTSSSSTSTSKSFSFSPQTKRLVASIILLIIIILVLVLFAKNPMNIAKNYRTILITFTVFIIMFIIISISYFSYQIANPLKANENFNMTLLFDIIKIIISIGLLTIFIYFIVNAKVFSFSDTSITSIIVNLIILFVILGLLFRILMATSFIKNNKYIRFLVYLFLYIPCFINDFLGIDKLVKDVKSTDPAYYKIILVEIALIILYFYWPKITHLFYKNIQGGTQYINQPVFLGNERNVSSYIELNGSDDPNYNYAMSFWFYIDSASPSTNASYHKYTNILSYGNKPSITYNPSTRTLIVAVQQKEAEKYAEKDENNNIIIYKQNDVLLQKWNNMVINYNNGTMDVFYNGELVGSTINIVPYISLDTIKIGESNGISGGLSNLVYYKKTQDSDTIKYNYNMLKNSNPPTI